MVKNKRMKKNAIKFKKLLHKTFKSLTIVFEALKALKTIIEFFH